MLSSYTVTTPEELVTAIRSSNASPAADMISLAPSAFTFLARSSYGEGRSILPAITAEGGALTIEGNGATVQLATVPGDQPFRLIEVAPGASATLKNLALKGGNGAALDGACVGGAILNQGTLTMVAVTLRNNVARGFDAGLWPACSGKGGAIFSTGSLDLRDCVIENNLAIGGNGIKGIGDLMPGDTLPPGTPGGSGLGGGIFVASGTATLWGCTIAGNTAHGGTGGPGQKSIHAGIKPSAGGAGGDAAGGGLYVAGGSVILSRVSVTANHAQGGSGGAAAKKTLVGPEGAGIGGGIYIGDADATLDRFTKQHARDNTASTKKPNIAGTYTLTT